MSDFDILHWPLVILEIIVFGHIKYCQVEHLFLDNTCLCSPLNVKADLIDRIGGGGCLVGPSPDRAPRLPFL